MALDYLWTDFEKVRETETVEKQILMTILQETRNLKFLKIVAQKLDDLHFRKNVSNNKFGKCIDWKKNRVHYQLPTKLHGLRDIFSNSKIVFPSNIRVDIKSVGFQLWTFLNQHSFNNNKPKL